jgi:hypothetical protein
VPALPNGEIFLRLCKFEVASGQRPVVSFDAGIERAIGQFETFGGAFMIMSRPLQRVVHTQALCFSNAQKFREDRPECKPGSIVEGDTDARASVFTLAFCQALAALARGTAYDRVGTRSNENEAFCSRQHHIRVAVAADKYEPCSGIAQGKIN